MLNTTAMAIWVLCDGDTDPDEMVDAICELSGLAARGRRGGCRRILLQFEEAGILTWSDVADAARRSRMARDGSAPWSSSTAKR